jgi:hypothetical protein
MRRATRREPVAARRRAPPPEGAREEVPLPESATELSQDVALSRLLDPFGDGVEAKGGAETQNGFGETLLLRANPISSTNGFAILTVTRVRANAGGSS